MNYILNWNVFIRNVVCERTEWTHFEIKNENFVASMQCGRIVSGRRINIWQIHSGITMPHAVYCSCSCPIWKSVSYFSAARCPSDLVNDVTLLISNSKLNFIQLASGFWISAIWCRSPNFAQEGSNLFSFMPCHASLPHMFVDALSLVHIIRTKTCKLTFKRKAKKAEKEKETRTEEKSAAGKFIRFLFIHTFFAF